MTGPGARSLAAGGTAGGLESRLWVARYSADTDGSIVRSAWLEEGANSCGGGLAFGVEPHRYPATPAVTTTMMPMSRATAPNFETVGTGDGGAGSRSGAKASWVRSSTTAMSPTNTWRCFRFQDGSDAPRRLAASRSRCGRRAFFGA